MSRKATSSGGSFRKCYAAAVFRRDAGLQRLVDRLAEDKIVKVGEIVVHRKKDFFEKYPLSDRTKRALLQNLKDMGLQFAD